MTKTSIEQGHALIPTEGGTSVVFERAAVIPLLPEFGTTPLGFLTIKTFSDAAMSDAQLAMAPNFALKEIRPEDRSATQIHATFDGVPFGKPFTYEIDPSTRTATQQRAASFLDTAMSEFPCK